ncbi:MAG TPA: DNA polymerase III subunit [Flavobacteriales bacterium]|nr:DNA polymerase III subunit [Flavobacteriales bacterium]
MLFSQIIGQEAVKNRLVRSVHEGRVSHAQLFLGPEGSGSLLLAIAYAQFILCSNKQEHDACGQCPSCMKVKNLSHPDLHFSFPFMASEADVSDEVIKKFRECFREFPYMNLKYWTAYHADENKQPQIGVKEAAGILNRLSLKAYEGGYKIMVIWMAEYMNAATANKLLKILEEPPEFTVFLLVCENQEGLLPTILSRTQIIKLPRLTDEDVRSFLTNVLKANVETAATIAAVSEGNIVEAHRLLTESQDSSGNLHMFRKWMQVCYKGDVLGMLDWVDEIAAAGRENQKNFLQYGLQIYRQCVMLHYTSGELVNLIGEEREFMQKFAPFVMGQNISQIHEEFNKAFYHIERNGNGKLIFFNLSMKLMRLLKMKYAA